MNDNIKKIDGNGNNVEISDIDQELRDVLQSKRSFHNTSNGKNEYIDNIHIKSLMLMEKGKCYYDSVDFDEKNQRMRLWNVF